MRKTLSVTAARRVLGGLLAFGAVPALAFAQGAPCASHVPVLLGAQSTFIGQRLGAFQSPYAGAMSLKSDGDRQLSQSYGAYGGACIVDGLDVYLDVEMIRGAGISHASGVAAVTNGDVLRQGSVDLGPGPYVARGFLRWTRAFGGAASDTIVRAIDALPRVLPAHRLEISAGKLAATDMFDLNRYANSTRGQFLDWVLFNNGAWDYAADTRGYTVGLTADYEDRNWGFRFAEALMPKIANGIDLVWRPWQVHAENFEYELRHGFIPKKAGVVRLLAYTNSANMGIYRDQVIQAAAANTTPDITNHPWNITRKYGFGINLEQNLTHYLTAFARFGWDNGKTESFAYTEVDQIFAEGVGANGAWWHRKQDRAGVAFISNGIKKDHQNYLAAGGLGFLLGDGHLNYGRENIFESYYTVHVWRGIYLAPGVQHINNPGYNRDRGPVVVPTFRAHFEF